MLEINESYLFELLNDRYSEFIIDKKVKRTRLITLFSCELQVSVVTIYNFINGIFSNKLLKNITNTLNLTTEELHKLVILYGINQ